jgi:hypothetical protein
MTEFSVEILRLHGDEPWEQWGGDWWSHADRLGTVPTAGPGGWQLLDHFRAAGVSGSSTGAPCSSPSPGRSCSS